MKFRFFALLLSLCLFNFVRAADMSATNPVPTQVVFICEHGSAKSVIAASYFNKLAAERGLSLRAVSRGVSPETTLQPATQAGLTQDGFDTSTMTPSALTADSAKSALRVVTIGIEHKPDFLSGVPVLEWNNVPAVSKGYPQSRDDMISKIGALIDEIGQKKTK